MHVSHHTHAAYYEVVPNKTGCVVRWYWYKKPKNSVTTLIEEKEYVGPDALKLARKQAVAKSKEYRKPGIYREGFWGWFDETFKGVR
jgi:hypothetical protein